MEKKFKKGMKVKTWLSNSIGTIVKVGADYVSVKYKGMAGYCDVPFNMVTVA